MKQERMPFWCISSNPLHAQYGGTYSFGFFYLTRNNESLPSVLVNVSNEIDLHLSKMKTYEEAYEFVCNNIERIWTEKNV